jgi:hypothetical protein
MTLTTAENLETESLEFTTISNSNQYENIARIVQLFRFICLRCKTNGQSARFSGRKQCFKSCKHPALVVMLVYLNISSQLYSTIYVHTNCLFISATKVFRLVDFLTFRWLFILGYILYYELLKFRLLKCSCQ